MSIRNAYEKNANRQLWLMRSRLVGLRRHVEMATGGKPIGYDQIRELHAQCDLARGKLKRLDRANEEQWPQAKAELDGELDTLRDAVAGVLSEVQVEQRPSVPPAMP